MQNDDAGKQAMKELRQERKEWIARAAARVKEQNKDLKGIKECLANEPASVPTLAEATGLAKDKVLFYLAAMKKYGQVVEDAKDGGYFRYALVQTEQPEAEA